MKIGSLDFKRGYINSTEVQKIYLGTTVVFSGYTSGQPTNEIWYTTQFGGTSAPYATGVDIFGANITDNYYDNQRGFGIIRFDGPVTKIGNNAFLQNALIISMSLPTTVSTIGMYAFKDSIIEYISLNSGLTTIGYYAFVNCYNLHKVSIPATVSALQMDAFKGCTGLTYMYFIGETPPSAIGDALGDDCPIFVPVGCVETYSNKGGAWAFAASFGRIKEIEGNVINFRTNLDSRYELNAADWKENIISYDWAADNSFDITFDAPVSEIPTNAFEGWNGMGCNMTEITLPNYLIKIDHNSFNWCSVSSITIPTSVKEIEYSAFENCNNLTEIIISNPVPFTLGGYAFDNTNDCPIYVPSGSLSVYQEASGWSNYYDRLQEYTPPVPCNIIYYTTTNDDLIYTGDVDFGEGITVVDNTYEEGQGILTLSGDATKVGYHSFRSECYNLSSMTLPNSITTIESEAFEDCGNLGGLVLPTSIEYLGSEILKYCNSQAITYQGTMEQFNNITKESDWAGCVYLVHCTDGDINI